ncbi:MAG: stage III sporulation protein AF [Oscillospiraceae bacterium]|nr:stage III sporulation protein AF [Oscillospiraceae bacterium]
MEAVRSYLLSVVAVCMITVVANGMIQKTSLKRIVRLIGGVLVLLVAIRPLLSLDMGKISSYLEEIDAGYALDTGSIRTTQDELLRQQVKETAEKYIENEAKALGGLLQAEITLSDGEYPVPVSVKLIGTLTPEQLQTVSAYIEAALNIPADRQEWRLYG